MGRLRRSIGLAVFGLLVAGCYTLDPAIGATPELGTDVAFDLNDAGRAAMGGQMGPAIVQIEGRLVQASGDEYVVGVKVVRLIGGAENTWAGEQVHLKREFVSTVYRRQFSAGRTALFTVAAVGAAVAAAIGVKQVVGSGTGDTPATKPETSITIRRPAGPVLRPLRAP